MIQKLASHKAVRYIIVGGCAFATEYLVFVVCYKFFAITVIPSNILSFLAGLTVSYAGQRYWTFHHKEKRYTMRQSHQALLFTALAAFNLILSTALINFLTRRGLNPLVGKVCVMVVVAIWNFLIFNRLIFFAKYKDESEN